MVVASALTGKSRSDKSRIPGSILCSGAGLPAAVPLHTCFYSTGLGVESPGSRHQSCCELRYVYWKKQEFASDGGRANVNADWL